MCVGCVFIYSTISWNGYISSVKKRTCKKCNTYTLNTILQNHNICNVSAKSGIYVMLLIFSKPENRQYRDILRSTWLTYSKNNTSAVRYVFLLGIGTNRASPNVIQEHHEQRDILLHDFVDSTRNLTLKTLLGITWVTTWCSSASYIMKTDDDVFVNIPAVLHTIQYHEDVLVNSVIGHCYARAYANRIVSKYSVYIEEYPYDAYPPYCVGHGYIMSAKVARDIVHISENIPYFFIEDVYIGMCLHQLSYSTHTLKCFNWDYTYIHQLSDILIGTDLSFYKSSTVCIVHTKNRQSVLKGIWLAYSTLKTNLPV